MVISCDKMRDQWNEESPELVAKEEQEAPEVTWMVSNTNTPSIITPKPPLVTPVTRELQIDLIEEKEEKPTEKQIEASTHYPSHSEEEIRSINQADESDEFVEKRHPCRERGAQSYFAAGSSSAAKPLKPSNSRLRNPATVAEALTQKHWEDWRDEIEEELESPRKHSTWTVMRAPEGVKPISARIAFLRKYDEYGHIVGYRVRLVVQDFRYGDVEHTSAPVV